MKKILIILLMGIFLSSFTSAALTDYLSQYYTFEDNREWISGLKNLSNNEGTPTYDSSGALIGKSGRISANNNFYIDNVGQLNFVARKNNTFNFWFNQTVTTNDIRLFVNNGSSTSKLEYLNPPGSISLDGFNNAVATSITTSQWHMVTLVANATHVTLWYDGARIGNTTYSTGTFEGDLLLGVNVGGANDWTGMMDEMAFWNTTISPSEIARLYNGGLGLNLLGFIAPNLNTPLNNSVQSQQYISFNSSINLINFNLTNSTLNVWYSNGSIFNKTTNSVTGQINSSYWNLTNFMINSYKWNVEFCGINSTSTKCGFAMGNYTFEYGSSVNTNTFNSSTYETSQEYFLTNITIPQGLTISSANFYWNGTSYSATTSTSGSNVLLSRVLDIPTSIFGNITWFWSLDFSNGQQQNLSVNYQNTSYINFTLCSSAPQSVPYLNFTFTNETTANERVTASISQSTFTYYLGSGLINKTLSYTNSNENLSFAFCFNPPHKTISTSYSISFLNSYSPQRTYVPSSNTPLTNSTTNQILYLLPTAEGIYQDFNVINTAGNPIANAYAQITRTLGSSTIVVGSGFTDDSGFIQFFVNPDFSYTATFIKSGYTTNTFTFTPSSSARTVLMGTGASGISNGTNLLNNVSITIFPTNDTLLNGTSYTFALNVTGNPSINGISLNVTNSSGFQLLFISGSTQGYISGTLNTGNNQTLIGTASISDGGEGLSIVKIWTIGDFYVGSYSIYKQMKLFNEYDFENFAKFLIVLIAITGVMLFLSSNELIDTSESKIGVLVAVVWVFSIVGWLDTGLNITTGSATLIELSRFSNQYGIAIVTTAIASYFVGRKLI